jgi:hypothetical protein
MRPIGFAIVLAVSLALAPRVAAAQPAAKTTKIGALFTITPAAAAPNLEARRKGLRELGYVEGGPLSCSLAMARPGPSRCRSSRASSRVSKWT